MKRWLREWVSYANVMSTLALFVALGGTSYALTLPRNSVGSSQLKSDSVGRIRDPSRRPCGQARSGTQTVRTVTFLPPLGARCEASRGRRASRSFRA